ncbi:hypothetical protein HK104_008185, partial [Borealophlyctis nickersoniae]
MKEPTDTFAGRLFARCVNDLENATFATAPVIMGLMGDLLDLEWDKDVDLIEKGMENAIPLLEENWTNSRYYPAMFRAFVGCVFRRGVVGVPECVLQAFNAILTWSELRTNLFPHVGDALYTFWVHAVSPTSALRKEASQSLLAHVNEVVEMLLFGPVME